MATRVFDNRNFRDGWAYDLGYEVISQGEIFDKDAIDQSIELILGTDYGERLFNISFGCGLQYRIFERITNGMGENLLNDVAKALAKWEDRITVLERDMRLIVNPDQNSIIIVIPYVIRRNNITSIFKKRITSNI